ncbi:MAG TPA: peptidoglycan DD-metalloendopeptidase family protein [Candidatus Nanoarchaeia archaeon]|nr:peptidoglycan DD-metalloendopeptidase family protein [Candidatus Nanoarchaeia archaeon]
MRTSLLRISTLFLIALIFLGSITPTLAVDEDKIEALKQSISEKNAQIKKLNDEIKALDSQAQSTAAQGQTLKATLATLEASRNKLLKEIQATQNKVSAASLTINQLALEIKNKEQAIIMNRSALAEAIRDMKQAEDSPLVENILAHDNMADIWNEIETLSRFQVGVREKIIETENLKNELSGKKAENENQKRNLISFQSQLSDQKVIVDQNKDEKAKLLAQTQNQEAAYRKQIAEKKALADAFEREISVYESQLKIIIDPDSYPGAGNSVLAWPLSNIIITQQFGNTAFARSGAYNGSGHNGVDFGASSGTAVLAALSGTVAGTGNTDLVPGCYSYGKWIMIKHDNGLSTLYGHLSLIKAQTGDRVETGEIIGYSGNTGYSTGPHLHFGVYATQGVKIVQYSNSINCKNAVIPVADLRAYLNPLDYLPK